MASNLCSQKHFPFRKLIRVGEFHELTASTDICPFILHLFDLVLSFSLVGRSREIIPDPDIKVKGKSPRVVFQCTYDGGGEWGDLTLDEQEGTLEGFHSGQSEEWEHNRLGDQGTTTYTISPTEFVIRGVSRSCGEVKLFQVNRATGAFKDSGRAFNYSSSTGQCRGTFGEFAKTGHCVAP
jgi:hypothetical protein